MDVQSPVQPSRPSGASEQEQMEVQNGDTAEELGLKEHSETDAKTDVDEQGMADTTAITEAVTKTDGAIHATSGVERDMETGEIGRAHV